MGLFSPWRLEQNTSAGQSQQLSFPCLSLCFHHAGCSIFCTLMKSMLLIAGLYFNDVFVYNTATDLFGYTDGLPINNASPDQIQLNKTGECATPCPFSVFCYDFTNHADCEIFCTIRPLTKLLHSQRC